MLVSWDCYAMSCHSGGQTMGEVRKGIAFFTLWHIDFDVMLVLMNSIGAWLKVNIGCHPADQKHSEEKNGKRERNVAAYLCFIWTISSLLSPRIFNWRLRSRTERVTNSSSVIPHWKRSNFDIGVMCNSYSCVANNEWAVCYTVSLHRFFSGVS